VSHPAGGAYEAPLGTGPPASLRELTLCELTLREFTIRCFK